MQTFRDLKVWQKAHELVLKVYAATQKFPNEEKFGLTSQLRRAIVSVAANIVEGFKRKSKRGSDHFYNIAAASLEESRYHLLLAKDLDYLSAEFYLKLNSLTDEVSKMLYSFRKAVTS